MKLKTIVINKSKTNIIEGEIMTDSNVGAGILSIITESLYDKPIVVFREYVQNSMDSLLRESIRDNYEIKIWTKDNNLFFLDNGRGISTDKFLDEMKKIGNSEKKKHRNLGYKGIGRLSGVPYCKQLTFVNIYDFKAKKAQIFTINGEYYETIKSTNMIADLSFSKLMDKISDYSEEIDTEINTAVLAALDKYKIELSKTNSGFLVILQDVSRVLQDTINSNDFMTNLQWLLPVDFQDDLRKGREEQLFIDLTSPDPDNNGIVAIKHCTISYNDVPIYRPIKKSMLRDYVCKKNFKYAIGFHTFNGSKIAIDKKNIFTGIRIYIDNMLLCEENELLQNLDNYGLLDHTLNGQLQSVRGIGAMIYITDKVSISANARRTFIEVNDNDSIKFLKILSEFVNTIYDARYALSNYASAIIKQDESQVKIKELKENALNSLRLLAEENVDLTMENDVEDSFDVISDSERKKIVKKKISTQIDQKINEYLRATETFNIKTAVDDFLIWLHENT